VQRRHQKLIEESPSMSISPQTRAAMCDAARRLIETAEYTNAATVEFIVDKNGNFYFIEVNARIQVEHPVSEMVTGIDLIKWQIRVAAGESLPWSQDDIPQRGAAIECRINAENPRRGFQPSPGKIEQLIAPGGFGVRFDSHAHSGYVVPPYYDSMIGKLIVHQPSRGEAISAMQRALAELRVEGIHTTVPIHQEILSHSAFVEARIDTTFVERILLAE
jgi:acetyl-CoA carboxylase biotin carboxylase subunit